MSSPVIPQQSQGGQAPGGQEQQQDPLQEFRALAQQVQALAQKYPEAAEGSATILKSIQEMMVRVSGNAQRNPEKAAPPAA